MDKLQFNSDLITYHKIELDIPILPHNLTNIKKSLYNYTTKNILFKYSNRFQGFPIKLWKIKRLRQPPSFEENSSLIFIKCKCTINVFNITLPQDEEPIFLNAILNQPNCIISENVEANVQNIPKSCKINDIIKIKILSVHSKNNSLIFIADFEKVYSKNESNVDIDGTYVDTVAVSNTDSGFSEIYSKCKKRKRQDSITKSKSKIAKIKNL
ncbi:hypothetical protein A3Q56_03918 [Intoshia linei]|uniref:Uncharacterized protein n=1 Tax=Intoshia linei TaxID=1819745 RepID=A0A177B3N2_9BILA|nr:hypothetical protein A3Q56_03918 [Intoshia linei]